jgi:hypothetical protein
MIAIVGGNAYGDGTGRSYRSGLDVGRVESRRRSR